MAGARMHYHSRPKNTDGEPESWARFAHTPIATTKNTVRWLEKMRAGQEIRLSKAMPDLRMLQLLLLKTSIR